MAKAATAKASENSRPGAARAKATGKSDTKLTAVPRASVTITDNQTGATFELPVMDGTIGPRVIDIRRLYTDHGLFTWKHGRFPDRFVVQQQDGTVVVYRDGVHSRYTTEQWEVLKAKLRD